jgi:hypothetical protein
MTRQSQDSMLYLWPELALDAGYAATPVDLPDRSLRVRRP